MRKRILLADDHELILAGVTQMLASEFEIVGVARDGRELVQKEAELAPELIVLDIGMPGLNGIDATRTILATHPLARIIVLTQQLSSNHVQAAFRAGARGYVAKQAAATELVEAIRATLDDCYYVTSLATAKNPEKIVSGRTRKNPEEFFGDPLTPRQREVLLLLAQGKSAKEIAAAMNISVRTVDFHKSLLMDELGLRTTAELTRYALNNEIPTE